MQSLAKLIQAHFNKRKQFIMIMGMINEKRQASDEKEAQLQRAASWGSIASDFDPVLV